MTNETKERIKYYRQALPNMKEKVAAAALMLVIALSVTVTATYAWITLSTAPEVTSVDTTVAANGSLEIALANGTGSAPGKSAVGDSTGANNPVTSANITWGNLVNLSDPSYGLSKITLRPAALNGKSGLLTNPLYGVGYGEDGRVSTMVTDDDFAYVYYDTESEKFLADLDGSHLGVRAISSVKYENLQGDSTLAELLRYTNQYLTTAKNNYASMTNESQDPGKTYIASLEGLIQIYAQNVIDRKSTSTLDITAYVEDLYEMMKYFKDSVMEPAGESYVQMANMLELMKGSGSDNAGYDVQSLVEASNAGTLPDYIKNNISSLEQYATDYKTLETYLLESPKGDYSDLTTSEKNKSLAYWAYRAANGGTVYWSNLNDHINWICDINTATLDGYTLQSLSSISVATKILGGSNPHDAVINGGAIYRMEYRIGQKMSPTISVSVDASSIVSFMGNVDMDAVLTTSAGDPEMVADRDLIKSYNTGSFKGDTATAEDTYAMAIDLWVRTNAGSTNGEAITETVTETLEDGTVKTTTVTTSAEQAYLTLEGAVVMGTEEKQATVTDGDGNAQPAYTASATVNGETVSMEVFSRYNTHYYMDENGKEVELESYLKEAYGTVPEITYTPKMSQQNVVVGYEGVNRVWNEEQMAGFEGDGTNTTQGGGSCYVFYANTPADQSRFLELLGSMKVVFVNEEGRQIGTASLDTKNYYAEMGKVTVPLTLDKNQAINLGTDSDGNTTYGLTALTKNVATRVTVLVYLDGTRLTNDMVLASGDIQGTLNIQFGSSAALTRTTTITESKTEGETVTETTDTTIDYVTGKDNVAIEDEEVMSQFVSLSAKVDKNSFEYDPSNPATTTLTVTVDGVEPSNVSAHFIRAISSTQGVLQDSISLDGSGSTWSTTCTFDKPGNYVLRSVWVDGVEYSLDSPVEVTVTGSSVNSLTCAAITDGSNQATIMTADSSYSTAMTLGFTSSKAVPSSVNGIFMDETGRQVNVPFTLKEGVWSGTAKFTTSGTFTMEYVEIDGDPYELSKSLQPTLEILLGLKVRTWITASDETLAELQKYLPTALATNFVINNSVSLQVSAEIYDNSGKELNGLSNVKLYYGRAGSSVLSTGLDSDLTWNTTSGRYVGSFNVTKAGTYKFSKVTVGNNTIENYISAPSIQAMPPEDAYYFNNYTEEYQYAPKMNAVMTIGIAYSNAATKVEATITNGTNTAVVEGVMGLEAEDQGDKSVNLWSFTIPKVNDSQEGEWTLKDIKMYGVYYDDQYYDEENGKTLDLTAENIYTKVANYLYVTLDVSNDREFNGYFMDDHKVTDTTVTIADFEGKSIDDIVISDVKVVYLLDSSNVSLSTYGYEAEGLESVDISGEGKLVDGSDTEYSISEMNFQHAGAYKSCTVSFAVNGTSVTAGAVSSGTKLTYTENGSIMSSAPEYKVTWTAPTITITATDPSGATEANPTGGTSFDTYVSGSVSTRNYYEPYYASLHAYYRGNLAGYQTYTLPSVTLNLTNAGSKLSSTNKATFAYSYYSGSYTDSVQFTGNNTSKTLTVGTLEMALGSYGGGLRGVGTVKVDSISIIYNDTTYTVALSDTVTIREYNEVPLNVTYEIPELYQDMFTAPSSITSYTGKSVSVALPRMEVTRTVAVPQGDTTTSYHYTETKQPIKWTEGSGCDATDYTGYKVTTVRETVKTGTFADTERTYATSKWTIGSTSYNAGTTRNLATGTYVISATVTYTDGEYGTPYTSTETIADETTTTTVYLDSSNNSITEPSGWSTNGNASVSEWDANE